MTKRILILFAFAITAAANDGAFCPVKPQAVMEKEWLHKNGFDAPKAKRIHHATPTKQAPVPATTPQYTFTAVDWMSMSSIFLLALLVAAIFYLVNRTIQKERTV